MSARARRGPTVLAVVGAALTAGVVGAACETSTEEEPLDPAAYVDSMTGLCATTADRLGALPTPPEAISEADWATEVSRLLRDEATAADALRPPDTSSADHRALVANTEEQAAVWQAVSDALATADDGAGGLAELTTEIGELTLGRDELVTEMGLDGCRRDL